MPTHPTAFDEAAARRVLLLRAVEAAPAGSLWTPEDAQWASRLARETGAADAGPERYLASRAEHAMQRLLPRDAALAPLLAPRWHAARWTALALAAGLLGGIAVDAIGSGQRINLLAPPVWAVIAWNLAVYLGLLLPWPHGLRASLVRRWAGKRAAPSAAPGWAFRAAWAEHAAPLLGARAALLLHAAAAALGLGLIAGLYLRGLVLDYRAGWQSTFLDAAQVHAALAALFAPASAISGIAVPDAAALDALHVGSATAPTASAAPWIHLYATTLLLVVLLPRVALALHAAWRARRLAQRLPLPLSEPYFQRLLRGWRPAAANVVQVLPCAVAAPQALPGLRRRLAASLGDDVQVQLEDALPLGEDTLMLPAPPPGAGWRALLVDLAATPEADQHGRLLQALRDALPPLPVLLLADEAAFARRFAALPARIAERRALWRDFAAEQGVDFDSAALTP